MTILTKIDSLFQKRKFVFLLFFFLILFQLVYSFIYPSADVSCDYWKNIKEMSFYEGHSESYSYDSFDNSRSFEKDITYPIRTATAIA